MHDFYLFIRPDDQVPGISEPVRKKGHVAWKPGIIFLIPEFFTLCEVYGYLSKFHLVCVCEKSGDVVRMWSLRWQLSQFKTDFHCCSPEIYFWKKCHPDSDTTKLVCQLIHPNASPEYIVAKELYSPKAEFKIFKFFLFLMKLCLLLSWLVGL